MIAIILQLFALISFAYGSFKLKDGVYVIESAHPTSNKTTSIVEFNVSGAVGYSLTFDSETSINGYSGYYFDYINICKTKNCDTYFGTPYYQGECAF